MPNTDEMSLELLPEEVVIAVLHAAGAGPIEDNFHLAKAFDEAATRGTAFAVFRMDRQYGYSPELSSALVGLAHGGSLVRDGLSSRFRASVHTLGPYGQNLLERMSESDRQTTDKLVAAIRGNGT